MRTIYASLPFYDSLAKQDRTRTGAIMPIHCPRHQLPPFLINAGTETIATVDEVLMVACDGTETDITSYFVDLPELITVGTDTYIQYDGATLNTILPTGSYYIKLSNQDIIYYSDWIRISNIYPNKIKSWTNESFDTFNSVNTIITSATNTGGGVEAANTPLDISVAKGEVITIWLNLTLNSGTAPSVRLLKTGLVVSNEVQLVNGINNIELTATQAATVGLQIVTGAAIVNFSTSQIWVTRQYSPNFMKLSFSNTNDLGDILYSTTYSQEVWLEAKLNNPTHEVVEIGDEKDGIFIAEKIVTKFIYRVIAYISRGLYNCLIRMPQSDSITITDEVGTTYTPAVGNVIVEPVDWVTYETGKVVISFNDGENSAFKWTNNMDNL